jgi:hypothetical protein
MCSVVFDIETGPKTLGRLKEIVRPFDASSVKNPGVFDPESVKYGNTKDPEKRAAKLEEFRVKHQKEVDQFEETLAQKEIEYWFNVERDAALSATTGRLLAVGYHGKATKIDMLEYAQDNTVQILIDFWKMFLKCRNEGRKMVGFCIRSFDIPFLVQSSWINGVDVPASLFSGRYLSDTFIDLNDLWSCGSKFFSNSLDEICRACGLGSKPDGVKGSDFHRLWADPTRRQEAIAYLANDLSMTRAFADRVGL